MDADSDSIFRHFLANQRYINRLTCRKKMVSIYFSCRQPEDGDTAIACGE